ncbi:OLC1v1015603C1 [Oldenlandia corymbosa var. corymbosa]|uniref:OLC1v1015603C1 n=1 Tax=Oldenlandia corymbosa var. corymbosa TaxID=529605 RepID=A0AAV1E3K2_OLDCO|nr:OLC1v1015603C1 [Oldenlandia corymbosa var. corymbosa]
MANQGIHLLKLAEERASARKKLEDHKRKLEESLIPYIPNECISQILVRLPLESLTKTRLVCKAWYRIVKSPIFAKDYLERSESSLIFLVPVKRELYFPFFERKIPEKTNAFSVESKLFRLQSVPVLQQPSIDPTSLLHLHFMESRDGMVKTKEYNATCLGRIRACCGGFILVDNKMKRGGLIVLNPVTRELLALPVGTIFPPHCESYGLAYCPSNNQFKLVHLFRDELQYFGCEILTLGDKSWRMVDGPAFGLFGWCGYDPVVAIGAIHWVPFVDHSEYIVSMTANDEKFQQIFLPTGCRTSDRIVEIRGQLGFVCHEEESKQIDVWCLKGLSGEVWRKQYTIPVGGIRGLVPLYFTRISGEMIFRCKFGHLYSYNCSLQSMHKLEIQAEDISRNVCCFPHVNSLLSLKVNDQDMF